MSPVTAALLGALIGALAGLAGGAFAAIAAIRSSQIAARAPLADKIHEIAMVAIKLRVASTPDERNQWLIKFETAWNDFTIHQRILCQAGGSWS